MNISLGLKGVAKSLDLEVEMDSEQVKSVLQTALDEPGKLLTLTDKHGQQVLINSRLIAYCQVGKPEPKRVGFGIG
ncbi:DUF3107 domain-containing protein [Varibaculum timonense]|uniref:DUF3107 domain-containing protein n=1 Tax=Varibaculum timonense TaxID=1964383 RepID=UPI0022E5F054|nr:DUF3107 domain-containing protein [Varibaculum timonense]